MKTIIILILMWGVSIRPGEGLVGYECGSSASNFTTLSLLNVEECDIPQPVLNITNVHIQFLQIDDYTSVHIQQCKIRISRDIRRCGMFSHTSEVSNGKASYVMEVSRDACSRMHEHGTTALFQGVISGLSANQSTSYPLVLAGTVGVDGKCTGGAYSDPYGSWTDVIVQADVKISLRDYTAKVGVKNDRVYLQSGIRCALNKGQCMDIEGGPTFWDPVPRDLCGKEKYSVLYSGLAERAVDQDSRTLYSLTTSDVTFALTATTTMNVCGQTLIRTEHPRLLIHEIYNEQQFMDVRQVDVNNMDIFAYINSKFVYVERHFRTQIEDLYYDLLVQNCSLEKEMLKNRLAIATQSPDEFAYHLMGGPGYMAVLSGEVVHIIKCIPMEVVVQHVQECYTQLPVSAGNSTYFMAPRTHVLMRTGTQVTCNRLMPPTYLIEGEWYGMTPNPTHVVPPETMKPMTKPSWKYRDTKSLATSGIYTSADLELLREHVMFPAERPSVLNKIARGMMGRPVAADGGSIKNLLEGPDFTNLVESAWAKAWEKFLTFGHISAGIMGIFIFIKAFKLIIDTIIHGYALHTVYGWSVFLLGAVWDSVTHLLLHLRRRSEAQTPTAPHQSHHEPTQIEKTYTIEGPQENSEKRTRETTISMQEIPEYSSIVREKPGKSGENATLTIYPNLTRD